MKIETVARIDEIPSADWDALVGENNPFVEHSFLSLLESSNSVGYDSGWDPYHITVRDDENRLIGAAPTYIKTDSYGEYIFDWMWVDVARRLGVDYYPKIVVAVPYTPATGPRLLYHPEANKEQVWSALVLGLQELMEAAHASSIHVLFCLDEEAAFLEKAGLVRRATHQFHWRNNNYRSFDDFLGALRSSNRKQIRKERRRVSEADIDIQLLRGDEAGPDLWGAMYKLYRATGSKKWGTPYLTRSFFRHAQETVGSRALLAFAREQGDIVAGTLSFQKGKHLYGRYWGSFDDVDCLHFELCYYQLIDYAIENNLRLLEAGAQGSHKVKRGFLPTITHSAHHMKHPILRSAFDEIMSGERVSLDEQIEEAQRMGPFREESIPPFEPIAGQDA